MNETDVSLYSSLRALRQGHAAWRLLAADQAAFIVSFFEREFLRPGRRAIPEAELLRDLEVYLGEVQQAAGESLLRPARAYLLAWADAEHGWLTRFHGADDVPCYDLTADAEQAVGFVRSLTREEVLGTESRRRTVVSLLDEIAEDRDEDAVMEDALEAGASDFRADEDVFEIYTEPDDFSAVLEDLQAKNYEFETAEIQMVPST